jgi:hypothetical protein
MKTSKTLCGAIVVSLCLCAGVSAADTPTSSYKPLETFAPFVYPQPATAFRTASGKPGPLFWQNRADYQIKATLEPATRKLTGEEVVTYTNHSPDDLDVLWLQVEQNRYRKMRAAHSAAASFRPNSRTASILSPSKSKALAANCRKPIG